MPRSRILSLLTGVLLMTATFFSLFSCALKPPSGEIVHAYLSAGAMDYGDSYSFSLTETEDGLRFSCSEDNGEGRVEFDDLPVPDTLLREFRRAAEDTGFADAVSAGKKVSKWKLRHVKDMTAWTFTLCWENGVERTSTVHVKGEEQIRAYLSKAARTLTQTPDGTGALDSLSLSASASWIEGSYTFCMHEEHGRYLYDAWFTEILTDEASGDWDERRIDFADEILTAEQVERIRSAAEEIGLRQILTAAELRWEDPNEEDEDMIPLDATTYAASASWGGLILGERGYGNPDWGVLMTVLHEIARDIAS